ncbi:MAG TPA: hypothetical protein VK501_14820 [Baekduia sp.]|uniref:hypothetical protein n=1 Tax=Baekduia sp. TaxID=2600305 RepID=UPI002C59F642|nr:hypothetical protein [Baekduia sp.]HMJ35181.1 hypothetical protein [Baekduia sp.]
MSAIDSAAAPAPLIGGPNDEQYVVRCSTGMEVHVYRGADGAWVLDVDTNGVAEGVDHNDDLEPYVRVCVNEGYVHRHSPPEPLSGSRRALGLDT